MKAVLHDILDGRADDQIDLLDLEAIHRELFLERVKRSVYMVEHHLSVERRTEKQTNEWNGQFEMRPVIAQSGLF